MLDQLSSARDLAERVRFSGDTLRYQSSGDPTASQRVLEAIFQNELRISQAVTPGLFERLMNVCNVLSLPSNSLDAFVYASPEIQAECHAGTAQNCVLRFSSTLVDLLDDDEFEFVVGHEVGHFLFGHGISRMEAQDDSVEYLMQQRAQEISVDRIGLIACGSLEVSVRAMMKTLSGLTGEHLRFDIGAFLRQLNDSPQGGFGSVSSHPSILVRCRALLWFSLNDAFNRGNFDLDSDDLMRLDDRIERDLAKFVDGIVRGQIDEAKRDLLLWLIASHVAQDGVLDKEEQSSIAKLVGEDTLERLRRFLSDIPATDVQDEIYQRLKASREDLERLVPSNFERFYKEIEEKVSKALK